MWIILGLISAFFLGLYDAVRKKALEDNPVIPVLFLASLTGALIFVPLIILSKTGLMHSGNIFFVPDSDAHQHLLAFLKALLVGSSWILTYSAMNMLPLTVVAPIRATAPIWTLFGAFFLFLEKLNSMQWLGVMIVLVCFFLLALAGRSEGIIFHRNKWIFAAVGGTLLGAASSLFDKYLFSRYNNMVMQSWYAVYLIPVLIPPLLIWYRKRRETKPFFWSPFIHLIGIILVISDFVYFYALTYPEALISILSVIRRSSVIIAFAAGALYFRENNLKKKGAALAGILIGVILIFWSTLK
jgi:bacterial/archaeal transporter family protein